MRETCRRGALPPAFLCLTLLLPAAAHAESASLPLMPETPAGEGDWNWQPAWNPEEIEAVLAEPEPAEPYFINGGRPTVAAPVAGVATRVSRTDNRDGSASLTAAGKLQDWSNAEVGIDVSLAARQSAGPPAPIGVQDGAGAAAWAKAPLPGVSSLTPWEQGSVNVRVDPVQEQGHLSTTFSRAWNLSDGLAARVTDNYGLTTSVAGTEHWESGKYVSVDVKPTQTSFSIGASSASGENGWLPSISASQTLLGGVNLTTSVAETSSGINRSITAGFRHTW